MIAIYAKANLICEVIFQISYSYQIHMTKKVKSVILSFCQGLSELVSKVCGNCYFGRNTSLLKKEKTATGNLM